MLSTKRTVDEVNAGIARLDKLGPSALIFSMCKDLTKLDEFLLLPYQLIFNKLRYEKEMSEYADRYREVIANKK